MVIEYPKLRPIEAIPAREEMVCLRDPEGFSDKLLLVPRQLLFVLSLFDGKHSLLDIRAAYTRAFGDLLFSDRLEGIIEQLDGALFLDSPRFKRIREATIAEFRAADRREPAHAGASYELEGPALEKQLEALFTAPEGPGFPRKGSSAGRGDSAGLQGLIVPHIDLRRGGSCFAWAYAELARHCSARTFVILGIAHLPTRRSFALTAKDFDTPLGIVPTDRGFVAELCRRCRSDFTEDEFVHRGEHSVEFQTIFLRYLFPGDDLRIVPILCALPREALALDSLESDAEVREFLAGLSAALEARGPEAVCIAAVDLSHVGRRFGQEVPMSVAVLQRLEKEDRAMIDTILAGDAESFFQGIKREGDRRNVCGVPAIYALLRLLAGAGRPAKGRLLRYRQAVDPATESMVSFMAAAFS